MKREYFVSSGKSLQIDLNVHQLNAVLTCIFQWKNTILAEAMARLEFLPRFLLACLLVLAACSPTPIRQGKVQVLTWKAAEAEFKISIQSRGRARVDENGIHVQAGDLITLESPCQSRAKPLLMALYAGTQLPSVLGQPATLADPDRIIFRLSDFLQNPTLTQTGMLCCRFGLQLSGCPGEPNGTLVPFLLPRPLPVNF
ncbi:MAG: hypothetical protein H6581_02000 [Bacteroidia bacterium]|nr:hypothetical protein [Bacteroidia bacterium]